MNWRVEHLGLAAQDPSALREWYVRVFSAREIYADGKVPPAFILELPGGVWVEVYSAEKSTADTSNNRLAGWRHLALRVDSLESARAALTDRGVVFEEPVKPAGGGGSVQFFRDPEGNLWHLVERPSESPLGRLA
jgi:glyoxylase I family protein